MKKEKENINDFGNKYRYLGYTYPGVPYGWKAVVEDMIKNIDVMVRPWYMPRFLLNWISDIATGGSVVRIRNRFFYNLLAYFTKHNKITTIKDKHAGLRVYGGFTKEVDDYVESVIDECDNICEKCGSTKNVKVCVRNGWDYNYCSDCRVPYKNNK